MDYEILNKTLTDTDEVCFKITDDQSESFLVSCKLVDNDWDEGSCWDYQIYHYSDMNFNWVEPDQMEATDLLEYFEFNGIDESDGGQLGGVNHLESPKDMVAFLIKECLGLVK